MVFYGSFSSGVEIDQAGRQKFAPRHDLQCIYSALNARHPSRSLRLSNTHLCSLFRLFALRICSFSVAAPKIWNSSFSSSNMYQSQPVVISRLTISTRPSNPLSAFLLAPQIRLLLTIVRVYKLHLLTCILSHRSVVPAIIKSVKNYRAHSLFVQFCRVQFSVFSFRFRHAHRPTLDGRSLAK